ncbi:MAG: hypothetical protein QXT64_01870 [Desulfurococcaceae archaeon]
MEVKESDFKSFKTDVDSLIEVCFRRIKTGFKAKAPDDALLQEINEKKEAHSILAELYRLNRNNIPYLIHLAKWGDPTTAKYDMVYSSDHEGATKTLLSLLITERALLAKKGLLKHVTVAIVGLGGSGKTTYAVASIAGALRVLGVDQGVVGDLVFFEPMDFVVFVKDNLEKKRWVPSVLLDDVGAQISKYWIWLGQKWWAYLFSVLDHVKDWCGVLVMTASSFKVIPSGLRDKIDLIVEAVEASYKGYVFNLFTWYRRDKYLESHRRKPVFIDVSPPTLLMPKHIWGSMLERRRSLGVSRLGEILERLREKTQEEEVEEGE